MVYECVGKIWKLDAIGMHWRRVFLSFDVVLTYIYKLRRQTSGLFCIAKGLLLLLLPGKMVEEAVNFVPSMFNQHLPNVKKPWRCILFRVDSDYDHKSCSKPTKTKLAECLILTESLRLCVSWQWWYLETDLVMQSCIALLQIQMEPLRT